MKPRQQSSGDFKPVDVGAHLGICNLLVDLGLQPGGQYDDAYKVAIGFQLPTQLTKDGKRMSITQVFTSSMNKKANLRKTVESWFGKSFPSEEAANNFDLKSLLSRYGFVNVIHKDSAGKTFANIANVIPLPQGIEKPALDGELLYYSPTDQSPQEAGDAYARLPEWLREKVDSQLQPPKEDDESDAGSASPSDDDIPF